MQRRENTLCTFSPNTSTVVRCTTIEEILSMELIVVFFQKILDRTILVIPKPESAPRCQKISNGSEQWTAITGFTADSPEDSEVFSSSPEDSEVFSPNFGHAKLLTAGTLQTFRRMKTLSN